MVAGLLIGGLAMGALPPNLGVWVASITSAALRGRAMGGLVISVFLGQFVTPLITVPLVRQAGVMATFGVAAIVSLLVAAAFGSTASRTSAVLTPESPPWAERFAVTPIL